MKSICLVIPYFGQWPKCFNIYLETCRYNPAVDWLFFTDCNIPEGASQNIKFFKMQLNDFNVLASQKLGLKVNLKENFTYKLVDFKPAYGVIFEDYLRAYDFWGHSDIDVVYGDIRKFITDDMLETYDVITAKKVYLVGHFTLYKNCDKMNRLYQKTADYKRVFHYTDRCYSFSECSKDWDNLLDGGSIFDKKPLRKNISHFVKCGINRMCELLGRKSPFWVIREVESMTECVKRLERKGCLKSFFETIEKSYDVELSISGDWKLCWQKGKLTLVYTGAEIMYFHLFWKVARVEHFFIPDWHTIPEKFFITKEGFFTEQEDSEITKK